MKIKEIMKSSVIVVKPNETIGNVLETINKENINGAPIVNDNNELLGIIVKADIYRFLMDPGHYESCPVEWVMKKDVVKASANEDVIMVAKRLRENNIIALPIVEGDTLVGIVSIEDFLDYFLEKNK